MDRGDDVVIRLCGRFAVTVAGQGVEQRLPGRQGRLVLAYLACNRGRPVTRDELIDLLWPDDPPALPDEVLGALLSKVRRAVGPGLIEGRRELTLVLPGGAVTDLELAEDTMQDAEQALAAGEVRLAWERARVACDIAQGRFLPGLNSSWVDGLRTDVERLRLTALERLAAAGVVLGGAELAAAERAAREVTLAAPLRESGYRLLMEALAARGEVAEALRAYEQLRVCLRDELGIVPGAAVRAVHEQLLTEGGPVDKPVGEPSGPSPGLLEERKVVTVLMADVAPEKDPERTELGLSQLRAVAAREAQARGGVVVAATGGGVLVTFGIPAAQEDHAERAMQLAHALGEELEQSAPLRIAIETGEVMVGPADPCGPPVLAAARMLYNARAGDVLVGERTASAARCVNRKVRPSAFVGREAELGVVISASRRVREESAPHLITIVGEAGVGKSRLVRELQRQLAIDAPDARQLVGTCLSYGRGVTYRAFAEVLRAVRQRAKADDGEEVIARLAEREILDLTLGLDVAGELHPLAALEQLRVAWVELLAGLVREGPALIVLEDLHWAQADLLDLVDQLQRDVDGPLMLVCTARPELLDARPSWGRSRAATTLWLEPLAPLDAARLVTEAPAHLREVVLERAEGNPFFLEELLARIGECGALERTAIPDSIHAVLAARIDQLPAPEKRALQAASVVGRSFWREAVQALVDGVAPSFWLLEERDFVRPRPGSSLEGLRELTFKHALTCDVAYGTLPRPRRVRLHAAFARWLENFTGGGDEHATVLAHHYWEAVGVDYADVAWAGDQAELTELRELALGWLGRAAALAILRYEIDESLTLLQRALELETGDAARCALYRTIARANALKFDGEAFWKAMETAAELAPDKATRAEIVSQLAVEAFVRAGMWTKTPAIEQIGTWVARALELAEPGTAARARALTAKSSLDLDDREAAAEAAAIAERLDDPELCVHAWDACGAVAMVAADYESACRWRTRRLELLDRVTDPDLRTIIAETPYASCVATGRFEQAREVALLHDRLTERLTPHHRMHAAAILVEVEELLGCWDSIRTQEARVRDAVAANAETPCLRNARSLLVCALAAACLRDDRHARELERAADELGLLGRQVLDAPRLRLALVRGDRARAEELLAGLLDERGWYARGHGTSLATVTVRLDALAMLGYGSRVEAESVRLLAPGTYVEPFALRALGTVRGDPLLAQQAIDRFERLGLRWHAAQTRDLTLT
jgi:DNA-binding SARP family transcriptional activator